MIRQPAVSGRFYPNDPDALREEVQRHIDASAAPQPALGVVVPHAGFMYSGGVAGSVYSHIEIPQTVLLLGPNHTVQGRPIALMSRGSWSMPFGDLEIDTELAEALMNHFPDVQDDAEAHQQEHSLETQLPFLHYFQKDFKFVPVCLQRLSLDDIARLATAVVKSVRAVNKPVLLVASSDMTHYESHQSASQKDRMAIERILELDPGGLYETVRSNRISMCGIIPVTTLLMACRELGASHAELKKYATSGEVSGDMDQVVGYAGMVVW